MARAKRSRFKYCYTSENKEGHLGYIRDADYIFKKIRGKSEKKQYIIIAKNKIDWGVNENHVDNKYRITQCMRKLIIMNMFECFYCGTKLHEFAVRKGLTKYEDLPEKYIVPIAENGMRLNIDHVIPRNERGAKLLENEVTSCYVCNWAKGHKVPENLNTRRVLKLDRIQGIIAREILNKDAEKYVIETQMSNHKDGKWFMEMDDGIEYLDTLKSKFDISIDFEDVYYLIPSE